MGHHGGVTYRQSGSPDPLLPHGSHSPYMCVMVPVIEFATRNHFLNGERGGEKRLLVFRMTPEHTWRWPQQTKASQTRAITRTMWPVTWEFRGRFSFFVPSYLFEPVCRLSLLWSLSSIFFLFLFLLISSLPVKHDWNWYIVTDLHSSRKDQLSLPCVIPLYFHPEVNVAGP